MSKRIYFVTQAKGGSGKSVLAFMLAEKYKEAIILDLDDATTTSMKQLAYRNPVQVSFLDPATKRIDRGAFNGLFESVIQADKELFIADLGASVAEQLPKYFSITGIDQIVGLLKSHDLDLHLVCVIGGGNIFKATMESLHELVLSVDGRLKVIVAHNGYYPFTADQAELVRQYTASHELQYMTFDLVKDKGEMALRTVENVLKNGAGIKDLSPFTAIYFRKPIDDLTL